MPELPSSTDVLIAGAGPTGLTLGLTLKRHGIDCLIVDPALEPALESRAIVMHAGSLERLDTLAVAEALVARGVVVKLFEIRSGGRLLARNHWARLNSRFPMVLNIPQRETETVLQMSLTDRIARGWAVNEFSQQDDAVLANIVAANEKHLITARFLVGCDGAHSQIRGKLATAFSGTQYAETFLIADCAVSGLPQEPFSGFFLNRDHGPLMAASLPHNVTRIGAIVDADYAKPTGADIQRILTQRAGAGLQVSAVFWSSLFNTHRRQVAKMRHGRVLLAGDAAHVHSPVAGQGMNLGIRDAFDLGHRLARHINGELPIETLDQYDEQRRAEARRVLQNTHRLNRLITATGTKRRVADAVMRVGNKVGGLDDRIMVETSGIRTPWPPGVNRGRRSSDELNTH